MKLNALILTALIVFSSATTVQAETPAVNGTLRNILHHKVRSHRRHQNNHRRYQGNNRRHQGRNHHQVYRGDRRHPQPYRTYRRRHNPHNQHHGDRRVNYY